MPHIESPSKSHAPKASYTPSSHQPKVADNARGTFESMLDDNAAEAKAAVKDANQSAAADRTQQTPAPKTKSDTNAADANKPADQTAAQTAAPDQTQAQTTDKPVAPAIVAAQTDAVAATVGTDTPKESKPESDKSATDTTTTPDAANALPVVPTVPTVPAVPAAPVVPTLTPTDAQSAPTQVAEQVAAAAPVVAAVAGQQQVQKADPAGTAVATDDTSKAVAKDGKDQPATTDQATDGDQVAAQPQQQAPVAGDKANAPHAALSKTDMEHIARARGESSDKTDQTSGRSSSDQADATVTAKTDVPTQTVQTAQTTHQTQATAATQTTTHTQTTAQVPVAVPLAAVAVSIANKAVAGAREFEIRLDPPELGRIEVKMHVDRDGNVTSRLIADRQDTLDLLKRDSSGLERALQDAGLKTSDNGLQFSLRDQSQSQQQQNDGNGKSNTLFVQDEKLPVVDVPVQNYGRLAGRTSGLDIRV